MAKKEAKIKQKSHYFKDMKAELKKVIWPTPKQLFNNTAAVLAFSIAIAVIVFVLDICFDSASKYGVTPLQEKIQSSYRASNESEDQNEETSEDSEEVEAEVDTTESEENKESDSNKDDKNNEESENAENSEN